MINFKILCASLLFIPLTSCLQSFAKSTEDDIDKKVSELISQMTLEEKLGQMNQVSPYNMDELYGNIKEGKIGSVLNVTDPEVINKIQKTAVEKTRLKIPVLVSRDVIHGYRTIFPIPLGQAATFDPEVVEKGARIAAIEASSDGIRWTFAPMIDIARDPRWGRIAESCGEDPYLTSIMGVAMVKGFQGDSLNDPSSIAACAKHFVAYGAAEGGKDYNSTFIPERVLRNIYLPSFEAAAKAGCATFMTSFNDNDGVPSTANSFILKEVLRKEWGYKGMVVTDWNSIGEMINHGFCKDSKDAAEKSLNAGVDMDMVSGAYIENIAQLLKEKKLSMKEVDEAVANILRLKFQLGLFENPYATSAQDSKYSPEALDAARESAEKSAILLKNNKQTLPLSSTIKTIAVVGPMANAPYEQLGTWVFDGQKEHTQTPLMALQQEYGKDINIIYEPGLAYSRDMQTAGIAKAVSAASRAEVVIVFVGEEAILSGEAHSLADLNLQGKQSELIEALAKTGKQLVTVVMAGRPLTIGKEVEASDAVLYSFHPGTMGGPAIANLLFGKVVPSGKTPVTFPKMVGQVPIYYAHHSTGRPASGTETLLDSIPLEAGQTSLGCTSFYLDAGFGPLYPFGYGLSYTTFDYSDLTLSADNIAQSGVLTASVELKNTGKYEATEVVQLYIQDKVGSVTRPVKELKGFQRITLQPGEIQKVTFSIPATQLAFWNRDMKNVVEPGDFKLWIGTNSDEGLSADFKVSD